MNSNFVRLQIPTRICEQRWPANTVPLVHTRTMTYNHESFIRECIEGIINQITNFPVLVLIHDDASSDETQTIIKEYANKYPHLIRTFFQAENTQCLKATPLFSERRKEFFSWAIGKYEALCEGDDYWSDPLKLQKQVDFLEANFDCAISFHDVVLIDKESKVLDVKIWNNLFKRSLTAKEIVYGYYIPTLSVLFRTEKYLSVKDRLAVNKVLNGDTFLFALLAEFGYAHFHADIRPGGYRIHNNGIHSGIDEIQRMLNGYNTYTELYKVICDNHKYIVRKKLYFYQKSLAALRINDRKYFLATAKRLMRQLWVHPFSVIMFLKLIIKYFLIRFGILGSK